MQATKIGAASALLIATLAVAFVPTAAAVTPVDECLDDGSTVPVIDEGYENCLKERCPEPPVDDIDGQVERALCLLGQ